MSVFSKKLRSVSRAAAVIVPLAGLAVLLANACGRDVTGTASASFGKIKFVKPAFQSTSTTNDDVTALRVIVSVNSATGPKVITDVPITNLDSLGNNGKGGDKSDSVGTVTVKFPLQSSGSVYTVVLKAITVAGDTVYSGSSSFTSGDVAAAGGVVVNIRPVYVGPGANATRVVISPRSKTLIAFRNGLNSFVLSAQAYDGAGTALPKAAFQWASSDTTIVGVQTDIGEVHALSKRGSATVSVVAFGANNPTDAVTVSVTFPAQNIVLVSGGGQSLPAGTHGSAIVVKTVAQDGVPVGGTTVNFFPQNGGSASPTSAVTASDGTASTVWTLGSQPGGQIMNVNAPLLQGVTVNASATGTGGGSVVNFVNPITGGVHGQTYAMTVSDMNGTQPVVGANCSWTISGGNGSVNPQAGQTGANGQATTSWTLGGTAGQNSLSVVCGGSVASLIITSTAAAVVIPPPTSP